MEISIDQDELVLRCTEIVNDKTIKCVVTQGGNLKNMAHVGMRGAKRQRPVLTKTDFRIVKFSIEYQVDILIIYYPCHGDTLRKIKQYMGKMKKPILISGICTPEDLDNIDDITKESDAIMLCRDILPYELEPYRRYKLSKIQKWLGAKCKQFGKPYLIYGDVFQHCLTTGEYCDSEVADVTNALLDGAHGFVLKNHYDIDNVLETIGSLHELLQTIEPYTVSDCGFWQVLNQARIPLNAAEACVMSCVAAANQTKAKAIVMPTVTGYTAKALTRMRPDCLVMTLSTNPLVTRRLSTFRCTVPLLYTGATYKNWQQNVYARINFAVEHAVKNSWLTYGDTYVSLQRATDESCFCDMIKVWKLL